MVINDDKQRIRVYLAGYPGSTHDNRLWRNMKQNKYSNKYFSASEYVLCDTAFEPSDICIPAYKTDVGFYQSIEKMKFNKAMSSPRVITEHTMGIWKGRIPWLHSIRMHITDDHELLENKLCHIDATAVLHTMIIALGNEHYNVGEELIGEEQLSDIGDVTHVQEWDCLDLPL